MKLPSAVYVKIEDEENGEGYLSCSANIADTVAVGEKGIVGKYVLTDMFIVKGVVETTPVKDR